MKNKLYKTGKSSSALTTALALSAPRLLRRKQQHPRHPRNEVRQTDDHAGERG